MTDAHTADVDDNITELSSLINSKSRASTEERQYKMASNASETEAAEVVADSSGEAADIAEEKVDPMIAQAGVSTTNAIEPVSDEVSGEDSANTKEVSVIEGEMPSETNESDKSGASSAETLVVSRLFIADLDVADDAVSRISSIQGDMCRICHCVSDESETLISPCDCRGSMKWVHQKCLQRWVKSRDAKKCELCGFSFNMTSSVKPFRKWKKLNMSSVERRRVLCSVTFHVVAITCVIWSLYVLIDRTTQEIQSGDLNWPFWTKLVVVAIGFTGGLVFMYVQCKTYVKLFRRWKQFNRVIYINDIQLGDDGDKCETVTIEIPTNEEVTADINACNVHSDRPATG